MRKFLLWIAVILWMALIFNLSSQVAEQSNELSRGITGVIVKAVEKIAPNAEFDLKILNNILRKGAHFCAYLVLGILTVSALRKSGAPGCRSLMLALGICVLYAISDEVHQLFVPGRGGQVQDVIIDSAGASVGIGVYWVVGRLVKRRRGQGRQLNCD
ncbi:MAG: VanZ family protein [Desulfotomaculaceae bacterium]|nr:VanZ family protein [Desulfotomaculaceae bacterium]